MDSTSDAAGRFGLSGGMWQRHANPWSVWTRFAALPLMIVAIWSRVWIGWWCLIPVALVLAWLVLNPFAFPPIYEPRSWSSKGIYGEKLWLRERSSISADHRRILFLLPLVGLSGMVLIAYGLIRLELWPAAFGVAVLTLSQLWRIDRFGLLYDEQQREK